MPIYKEDMPTKKTRSCSDGPGSHMTAAWKLILYRALNVRYINVNAQAQKGHVTFRFTYIPAAHGIAARRR